MAPTTYSGALQPKKKSELQEIALALRLSDQGTKDELQARIKRHLDNHQDALEDDPIFSGLFGRRRKSSVQPQPALPSGRFAPVPEVVIEKPRSSTGRRIAPFDPIKESTPPVDLRDVSHFLKHIPFSPPESTPANSPRQDPIVAAPNGLSPLPPSPERSIVEHLPRRDAVQAIVKSKQQVVVQNGRELLTALRLFLSNSRNIWSLTAVCELLFIVYMTVPWQSVQVPVSPKGSVGPTINVRYPPWTVLQSPAFWHVLLHWAIPTLILPTLVGSLVSFNTALSSTESKYNPANGQIVPAIPATPFDPLTSSIIRLAAQTAYPYDTLGARFHVVGIDVLGSQWRILSASVGLAFAFAEAIGGAPEAIIKTMVHQNQEVEQRVRRRALPYNLSSDRESTSVIMGHDETEVD